MTIQLNVHSQNKDTGEIELAGSLNKREVNFLIQFAINQLMVKGVLFHLTHPLQDEKGEDTMRIEIPEGVAIH